MKGLWIGVLMIFAWIPAAAQEDNDFDFDFHAEWFAEDGDEKDVFVWLNDLDVPELPGLPGPPMFEFEGEFDVEAGGMEMMLPDDDELKITKEQRDKMRQIRDAARKQNIPLEADVKLKRLELRELMRAESPSKEKVASKVKEIDAIKTQIKINRMNSRIDVRNVLTKEQRDKLEEMRAARRFHWKGFPGFHMRHEGPHKMKHMMRLEKE